jgi:hypothetical protein
MKNKRLFTFGCSFTSYAWPTWANFLGMDFEHSENWGLAGIGNRAISERVTECHVRNKFREGDVVIVQWTSHLRNDWYHITEEEDSSRGWKTRGAIFNYINEKIYDRRWIAKFFYEPAYLMHSLNNIFSTICLLESTGCTWYMTGMGDVRNMGTDIGDAGGYGEHISIKHNDKDKKGLVFERIPEFQIYQKPIWEDRADHWLTPLVEITKKYSKLTYSFVDTKNPIAPVVFQDFHPTPSQHILWLEEELKDKLDIPGDLINNMKIIAGSIDALQGMRKTDKRLFEYMVCRREFFPDEASKLIWPTRYIGF